MRATYLWPIVVTSAALISCGPPVESDPVDETPDEPVTCEGPKCDGLSARFRDAYDDMRNIETDDLVVLGAGLASDELNGVLGDIPYATLQISPTALYGSEEEVLGQTVVHDLDELGAGLTQRFGEEAFASRVVEMRRSYAANSGSIWGESHFAIGPSLGHDWSFDAGDAAVGAVGFTASATVETVVISPYEEKREALVDAPLASIKETRGWVMPRDTSDIQEMVPGESLSMRAGGALGLNLGVGVPFLVSTIGTVLSLHARLNLGARVALTGKLDVQLVRGEGNDVFLDVGIDEQDIRAFAIALTTGYGVSGLPEVDLDLGVVDLSITELAEKTLRKQLTKHIAPSLSATTSKETSRLTVARFQFDLANAGDDEFEQAIAQAMRGDIRLAQAVANRGDNGVQQILDLTKDSHSEANYVGFRFLGMEFYRAQNFDTGTVTIETDGGNQTLLFSELEQKSGFFFTDREYEWRKVVSIENQGGRLVDASVNARMTIREADSFLSRDQMLDHVDPLVGYLTGFDPLWSDINVLTDELGQYVDTACGDPDDVGNAAFRDCLEALPTDPTVQSRRQTIEAAIDEVIAGDLNQGFDPAVANSREVAGELLAFKTELAARNDRPDVGFYGPNGKMLTQIRFSNEALETMMAPGQHRVFQEKMGQILRLMASKRNRAQDGKQEHIDDYVDDRFERLEELGGTYGIATLEWADLNDIATVSLNGQKVGDYGHMITIPEGQPDDLDVASIAEHKGKIVEKLIPTLVDEAAAGIFDDLDEPTQFLMAYALLWMAEPGQIEVLANYVFDDDDDQAFEDLDVYARGTSPMIEAGRFDLDELLGSQ